MHKTKFVIAAVLSAFLATPALAHNPDKSIKNAFPNKLGGGIHMLAVAVTSFIQDMVPQPMRVITMPGAGTVAGTRQGASQLAHSYTLLFVNDGRFLTSAAEMLGFKDLDKLETIAWIACFCFGVVASPKAPFSNLKEIQSYAQKRPGQVNVANNIGSVSQMNVN